MAITHNFNNDSNYTDGGQWLHDYGQRICKWQWDASTKIISVTCGINGSTLNLSEFGEQQFTDEKLIKKLPTLAIEMAEKINKTKYNV